MATTKYSHVTKIGDITVINDKIRKNVKKAKTRSDLTKLYRQSMYLFTLSKNNEWKKNFAGKLISLRKRIKKEFTQTVNLINKKAEKIGSKANYDNEIN